MHKRQQREADEVPPTPRETPRDAQQRLSRKAAPANQRAAARMLELLDETGADLSDEGLRGAWRDGGRG